jgi:hypothetical protein
MQKYSIYRPHISIIVILQILAISLFTVSCSRADEQPALLSTLASIFEAGITLTPTLTTIATHTAKFLPPTPTTMLSPTHTPSATPTPTSTPDPTNRFFRGIVVGLDQQPITDTTVCLVALQPQTIHGYCDDTDASGRFQITKIQAGEYSLSWRDDSIGKNWGKFVTIGERSQLEVVLTPPALATVMASPTPAPAATIWLTPPAVRPEPHLSPKPISSLWLRPPMLIDSEAGRLYMSAQVGDTELIVALAAADGSLLTTYPVQGQMALDRVNGWLYVDQEDGQLAVINLKTNQVQATIPLPKGQGHLAPQADPAAKQVLVFRDDQVHRIDPLQGISRTLTLPPPELISSAYGSTEIRGATYDSSHQLLYLKFDGLSYGPHRGASVVAYDLNTETKIAQQNFVATAQSLETVAFEGVLYGTSPM